MGDYAAYVGVDAHARSVAAKALVPETGEHFRKAFPDHPAATVVAGWLAALPQPAHCAYESGCTGFRKARDLWAPQAVIGFKQMGAQKMNAERSRGGRAA